jgi:hypothetical protein
MGANGENRKLNEARKWRKKPAAKAKRREEEKKENEAKKKCENAAAEMAAWL